MQLISLVEFVLVDCKSRVSGQDVRELARVYRFAWKVWGAWTPLVWWCVWWPAWLAGLRNSLHHQCEMF